MLAVRLDLLRDQLQSLIQPRYESLDQMGANEPRGNQGAATTGPTPGSASS